MTNTKATGFNPARSQVNHSEMLNWLRAPINGDLQEVPGIGPVNAKHLKDPSTGQAITTTQQLIGYYLSLKHEGISQQDHQEKMWEFLQSRGLNSHRSGIVDAIASKMNVWMPGTYQPDEYVAPSTEAAKPLEEVQNNTPEQVMAVNNENTAPTAQPVEASS